MAEQGTPLDKDGQNDLAVLFPDRHSTIAGVPVTMREYSFLESLEHHACIAAFSDAITGIALAGDFADLDSLRSAFGQCRDQVIELIALACDQPVAWVRGLGADDGEALMMLWWGVNAHFFLRRVLLSVQLRKQREFDGAMSSEHSSQLDTLPGTSGGTRSAN